MAKIKALAISWHSDDFPGWIEVSVRDAFGTEHRIVDKVPILTSLDLDFDSSFPVEIWIDADAEPGGQDQRSVTLSYHVETSDGLDRLTMNREDVVTD